MNQLSRFNHQQVGMETGVFKKRYSTYRNSFLITILKQESLNFRIESSKISRS